MALPHSWPGIPGLEHRRHRVEPWHLDRPAGLQHHDRARIRRRHRGDEFVLAPRQRDVLEIAALGVPFAIAPDEDQRDLGLPGRLDSSGDLGIVHRPADADAEGGKAQVARRFGGELDDHLMVPTGGQVHRADHLVAALLEEGPPGVSSRSRHPRRAGRRHEPGRGPRRTPRPGMGRSFRARSVPVSRAE